MNIQPRYDISPTSMPLVVKLSNPTTAGDNRRGGACAVGGGPGAPFRGGRWKLWTPTPAVWYPRRTPTHGSTILRFIPIQRAGPTSSCYTVSRSSCPSQISCLIYLLCWCDYQYRVIKLLVFLLPPPSSSFLFLFYLFSLIFIFWNRMLLCSNGVTSRAFVPGEKTMGGSWCFGVGENWEILMTLNPWWRGCMNTSKIFWFYGNL